MFSHTQVTARAAGLAYLIVVISGFFSLMYVPSQLLVWGEPATTAGNILANEGLFRLGLLAGVICYSAFAVLALILYQLFNEVHKPVAMFMLVLALLSVPISMLNLLNKFAALQLLSGEAYLNSFGTEQLHTQVMFFLGLYDKGIEVVQVFWGLWLLPLGMLIFLSSMLPKTLGLLLILGCGSYLLALIHSILGPAHTLPGWVMLPATLGEIGTCLWLLIFGVKRLPQDSQTNS